MNDHVWWPLAKIPAQLDAISLCGGVCTLLGGIAKQKDVLLDQDGTEEREDSTFWRMRRGMFQEPKVICYISEGWKAAWVVGHCGTS